ncbi:MAG: hypothetical protein L0Z55_03015 [Planctomycetes bacterium]|nr:hypothetical protein [Planctomycetota bacterium]
MAPRTLRLLRKCAGSWALPALACALLAGGCDSQSKPQGNATDTPAAAPASAGSSAAAVARGRAVSERACAKLCHRAGNVVNAPLYEDTMKTRRAALATYDQTVARLKVLDAERYEASKAAIDAIAAEPSIERRTTLWLRAYLANPSFESGTNRMLALNPPLTEQELNDVISFLLTFP